MAVTNSMAVANTQHVEVNGTLRGGALRASMLRGMNFRRVGGGCRVLLRIMEVKDRTAEVGSASLQSTTSRQAD